MSGGIASRSRCEASSLVNLIVCASPVHQSSRTFAPPITSWRGQEVQASVFNAIRRTTPSRSATAVARSGSSAAGSRVRGHHPPFMTSSVVDEGQNASRTGGCSAAASACELPCRGSRTKMMSRSCLRVHEVSDWLTSGHDAAEALVPAENCRRSRLQGASVRTRPTGGAATGGAGPPHRPAVPARSGLRRAEQRPVPHRRRAGTSRHCPGRRTRAGRSRRSHGSHRWTACSATAADAATTAENRHPPCSFLRIDRTFGAPASGASPPPGWSCASDGACMAAGTRNAPGHPTIRRLSGGMGGRAVADLRIPEVIDVVQPTLAGRPRCHRRGR